MSTPVNISRRAEEAFPRSSNPKVPPPAKLAPRNANAVAQPRQQERDEQEQQEQQDEQEPEPEPELEQEQQQQQEDQQHQEQCIQQRQRKQHKQEKQEKQDKQKQKQQHHKHRQKHKQQKYTREGGKKVLASTSFGLCFMFEKWALNPPVLWHIYRQLRFLTVKTGNI